MNESTGVVLSARPVWLRAGDGRASKHLRLRVEYETDDGLQEEQFQVPYRPGIRVGSTVTVAARRGRGVQLVLDETTPVEWWRPTQVRSGLLAYAAILGVMLIFGGVVLGGVMYGSRGTPAPPWGPGGSPVPSESVPPSGVSPSGASPSGPSAPPSVTPGN